MPWNRDHLAQRAARELRRLRRIPPTSPEAGVARGFLDWVLALPWQEQSGEELVDFNYAAESYDAVILLALAALKAQSTDAADIAAALQEVSGGS